MRVEVSNEVLCQGEASCGLALACIDGRCGPCTADDQCAAGEACVLDHCVPAREAECRSASDCAPGELCVLSGYSAGPRGNEQMRAYCLSSSGGSEAPEGRVPPEIVPAEPRPVSVEALREALDAEIPQIDASKTR
jgi:hypothetical protein